MSRLPFLLWGGVRAEEGGSGIAARAASGQTYVEADMLCDTTHSGRWAETIGCPDGCPLLGTIYLSPVSKGGNSPGYGRRCSCLKTR